MSKTAVYIHIPFCKQICSYCDFCKFLYQSDWVDNYLYALKQEIRDRYLDEEVKTIYFGGGTPSCLNQKQLNELLKIIRIFNKTSDCEITFECNLNDITDELITLLVCYGVNRLSIGIESFDQKNLLFLNRQASFSDAQEKIQICWKHGLTNINVDLIYALPKESIITLAKDLNYLIKLNVPHVSTYSLMIEKHTMLSYKHIMPINEDLDSLMYKLICHKLKKEGYIHYEISNFAKEGYESKHNLVYWSNEEYYGFGLGASGYIEGIRYSNTKNLSEYLKGYYVKEEEILSEKDKMDYEIILGLRKMKGLNINDFYLKYHVNIKDKYPIDNLLKERDLIEKDGNIFINPDKLYIMNEILIKLI